MKRSVITCSACDTTHLSIGDDPERPADCLAMLTPRVWSAFLRLASVAPGYVPSVDEVAAEAGVSLDGVARVVGRWLSAGWAGALAEPRAHP